MGGGESSRRPLAERESGQGQAAGAEKGDRNEGRRQWGGGGGKGREINGRGAVIRTKSEVRNRGDLREERRKGDRFKEE